MKTLITTLFAFALGFFELGFQLHFQFDKISTLVFIMLEVFSLVFFVCGLSLSIILIKSEGRDKDLKVLKPHFENMREASPNIIPNLQESYGQVYVPNSSLDRLPNLPLEFIAHFPKEASTWNTYCSSIKTHNEKCREFVQILRHIFESAGINVIDYQTKAKSPCIYEMIFDPLFLWWSSHSGHSKYATIDFAKIDTNLPVCGNLYNLYVSGCNSSAIAYTENEIDKKKCQDLIISIAFNPEYEKEAADLIKSAAEIAESVNTLRSQLISTIQNIHIYWPNAGTNWSTKEYRFRRLRDECPTCKHLPR